MKKHETLQFFLSEILGMDSSSASSEACTLEHSVSDETVDRLGNYLKKTKSSGENGADGQKRTGAIYDEFCTPPSLLDFDEGDELVVRCILGQSCAKRLLDLGVVPGEKVKILRKLGTHALVLQVKGCDVALSPEIAAAVSVDRFL
jgi:DtxR family Mn-dependent transcriptional regulator